MKLFNNPIERGRVTKKAIGSVLLILSVAFITSCGAKSQKPRPVSDTVTERLIVNECKGKKWINNPPKADARFLYFVGKSEKFATERGSRDAAMLDVTEQFVKYTGIEVSTLDEILKVSYGLSSQVTDATVSGKSRSKAQANAFVSRIKAREWCGERYQRMSGNRVVGRIYLATLLAAVPRSELENVKRWQKGQEEKRKFAEKRRLDTIQEKRDGAYLQARSYFNSALKNEKRGLLIGALGNLISAEKSLRAAEAADPKQEVIGRPIPKSPSRPELRMAETRMTSGISLDGIKTHIQLEPGAPPARLTVVATYSGGDDTVPIAGIPILFMSGGRIVGGPPRNTNRRGEASMTMPVITERGQFNFTARVARGNLRQKIPRSAMEAFAGLQVNFQITVAEGSIDDKAVDLVALLERGVRSRQMTIVVENFTFEDTGQAGPFINRFKEALSTALIKSPRFQVKRAKSRKGQDVGSGVKSDSPVALAQASGSQSVLFGKYSREGSGRVRVRATLRDISYTDVASGSVNMILPPGMPLTMSNSQKIIAAANSMGDVGKNNDFKLDLWIDKGDGGIYREGEKLYVNIKADRDCYVKLVYFTASGDKIVIFPNEYDRNTKIQGNRLYQIPNESSAFDFVIEPPFGAEMLIAFASTKPLPVDYGQDLGGGMVALKESLGVIAKKNRRGVSIKKRKVLFAEKRVNLTTMRRN